MKPAICKQKCRCGKRCEKYLGHIFKPHTCKSCLERDKHISRETPLTKSEKSVLDALR